MATNLWLSFAFLSASIAATLALLDKIVATKQLPPVASASTKAVAMFLAFIGFAVQAGDIGFGRESSFVQTTVGPISVPAPLPALAMLVGVFYISMLFLYYKGVERTDISRFVPVFNTDIVIVLIFGAVFLGEAFPLPVYGGVLLVFFGVLFNSLDIDNIEFTSKEALLFGLSAALAISIVQVLMKFLMSHMTRYQLLFWYGIGGIVSVALLLAWHKGLDGLTGVDLSFLRSKGYLAFVTNGVFSALSYLVLTWALETGPVSIVTAILNLQVLLVFFGVIVLSNFTPEVLKEDMSRTTLIQKGTAMSMMLCGAVVIQFFT
jgi:uncharacterized membrane protein